MRFKNISPSTALFKNEINKEHTTALHLLTEYKMYPGVEFS